MPSSPKLLIKGCKNCEKKSAADVKSITLVSRHECLMMSKKEGWISYGLEAIEQVLQQEILWKQFSEAIRIMQLIPHKHASNQSLSKTLEQSRNRSGTPKGFNVQDKPLRIPRYPGLPPLLAERTLKIYS